MAEHSAQERTEEATPKRRQDARKKGQVPRSRELNTFTSLVVSAVAMMLFGRSLINGINQLLAEGLSFGRATAFSEQSITLRLELFTMDALAVLFPVFGIITLATLLSPISLGGLSFNTGLLAPKAERISLIKGIGRLFSAKSLMELLKALGKFVLVSSTACLVLYAVFDEILRLPLLPLAQAYSDTGELFIWCLLGFSSVLIVVVLMDVPFQLWEYRRQLRMTRQEVKDEMKETEGRPEVKSAIREKQQEFARQRMMSEIPTADVVITNPTHYAVALRYEQGRAAAPKVVAKGRDLVAARIRELAQSHNVAIFSAPPLARALYVSTELEQEIPGNLFLAVAQVLAYVFQLRQAAHGRARRPRPPRHIPVPVEYEELINKRMAH